MRRALKLVLVIGIVLGLVGQTVAVAGGPSFAAAVERVSPTIMPAGCPGMTRNSGKNSLPCDCMTLACIAGMGCLTIVALEVPPMAVGETGVAALPPTTPPFRALQGRSLQPEQHPPSTLV